MQTVINNLSKYVFVTVDGKIVCNNSKGVQVQPKGNKFYVVNDAGNKVAVSTTQIMQALKKSNGLNRFGDVPDYSIKLNMQLAQYIRFRVAVGKVTLTHLANAFNVDLETIAMVVKNATYKDPNYFVPIKYAKPTKHNAALLPACIVK